MKIEKTFQFLPEALRKMTMLLKTKEYVAPQNHNSYEAEEHREDILIPS